MARTTRRREPSEVVNLNRGSKKNERRSNRKNIKKRIQEIDYTNPDFDDLEDEEYVVRGVN